MACGSGPAAPMSAAPTAPAETHTVVMKPVPQPDAGLPAILGAPEPPKLACEPGTSAMPAPAPEPTWFCGRPDGTRHGPFVTLYPDGTNQLLGAYRDGKLDGAWQRYYPGGSLAEEGTYAAGKKDGHWRQLGPTGTLLGEYDMKAGTGTEKYWFSDGPLYSERQLRGGVPNGSLKVFDHDGQLVIVAKLLGGKYDGTHLVGAKNTLRIEEEFKYGVRRNARQIWQFWDLLLDENYDLRGKLDGVFTIWRDSVKKIPRVTGTYDHGKRTGTWSWFDHANNKEREGDYTDGKKTGAWFEWFENKLVFSGSYVDGNPDGDFVYYDKAGNELGRFTMTGGTGVWLTFYPNHKPSTRTYYYKGEMAGLYQELTFRLPQKVVVEGHYSGDRKSGSWKEWTDTGELTLEEHYKRGRLDGVAKKYDAGKAVSETTYKDGKVDGAYTEYRNGKPALTGQYSADRKIGTWTTYDEGGAVVLTATYKDGVLEGPWRELVDGAVLEGAMTAGRRTGTWTRTDRAGIVQKTTYKTPASG
jgi:antitoxin component YwqK of YwqJK toxin-antitoxin module